MDDKISGFDFKLAMNKEKGNVDTNLKMQKPLAEELLNLNPTISA